MRRPRQPVIVSMTRPLPFPGPCPLESSPRPIFAGPHSTVEIARRCVRHKGAMMVIVDTALEQREKEGKPVRVGIVGAGYMGRAVALQLLKPAIGMRLVALYNRTPSKAQQTLRDAGLISFPEAASVQQLDESISRGEVSIVADPLLVCDAHNIDVIIDATSDMECG